MKRREALRLVPISIAGMAGMAGTVFGKEMCGQCDYSGHTGSLAHQYSLKVRERLNWIRKNQSHNLMEAAYRIAQTVENGGQCYQYAWDAGHSEADSWPDRNGEPEIFNTQMIVEKTKKGDLVIASGQLTSAKQLKDKGVIIIGRPSPWSGDARYPELLRDDIQEMKLKPFADLWIETQATSLGGVVNVPGMPAPFGPVSGIVGKTTIWMMLADACRILARRGISVPVKGDEPKVSGDNTDYQNFSGWVNLHDPLMDNFFDEVMNQLELIFADFGKIRKIATMAVDSVLNGGTIYGYSLQNSVYGEASTRRSGLSMTQGVKGADPNTKENFKGTDKDFVIMGITKPDDKTDLEFLDLFRKRGMKVASIGPMTRSAKVPQGRTVPKETDIHAGRMCDTYGLFAVPGFNQRICPTSGIVLDHLYWTTIMEVVEQYIQKTGGDVPGVYLSGALKGGMEHLYRMRELYLK
ncbi:MAG: hypothetical protein JXB48_22495 [Candidatus Latescibacteria bacterium]|nr:hypothetical protein [Candidatus Latescibacterota bacterium]